MRRWGCVLVGLVLLVGAPFAVRAIPVPVVDIGAGALVARIQASQRVPYSGLVSSTGSLALPQSSSLAAVAPLLAGTTRSRVWWTGGPRWRVDTLSLTGETDLIHSRGFLIRWNYELKRVTVSQDPPVRLPNASDVLPSVLARRVLAGARPGELMRLPVQRVAGRLAPGVRLTPADPQASIDHVDVYADRQSAVPLRVSLFARGSAVPVLTSAFEDVYLTAPAASTVAFSTPADATTNSTATIDLAEAANRFSRRVPPARVAGLPPRRVEGLSGVGLYGRGPTALIAIPLWGRIAEDYRRQLRDQPGVTTSADGLLVSSGPLSLVLGAPYQRDGDSWLVAGTVTTAAALRAAAQLHDNPGTPR